MKILAIETSCDETAIAIAEFSGPKSRPRISILSNIISSQIAIHKKFGGVVPNLARREHEKNLVPILREALKKTEMYKVSGIKYPVLSKRIQNTKYKILDTILAREPELFERFKKHILPLPKPEIDAVAVTYGPGLAPALWVGVNFARALSVLWEKPLIPVNHMAGHFYSAFLQKSGVNSKFEYRNPKQIQNSPPDFAWAKSRRASKFQIRNIQFPALALLVSGGHTELVLMRGHGKFKIIGETRDDAAGEAFDKVARILGLPYPGGPQISALAEIADKRGQEKSRTNAETSINLRKSMHTESPRMPALRLPRPMMNSKDNDFSFSGLKTAVLYLVRDLGRTKTKKMRPFIAKEFQDAVVDVLIKKTLRAAKAFKAKTILLGGGVAANHELRKRLEANLKKELPNTKYLIPNTRMTGDNALMIAIAAHFVGKKKAWNKVHADANARLGS